MKGHGVFILQLYDDFLGTTLGKVCINDIGGCISSIWVG